MSDVWEYIGNLRGPAGHDATGAAEDDAAIGSFIEDPSAESNTAVTRVVGDLLGRDLIDHSSNVSEATMGKWWDRMILAAGGGAQARITVLGDSTPHGQGSFGPFVTAPWPGRLQRMFNEKYGPAGVGFLPMWNYYGTSGGATDQPKIKFFGSGVADSVFGVNGLGSKTVTKTGSTTYIEVGPFFCDTFRISVASSGVSGQVGRAYVDTVDVGTFKTHAGTTGTTFPTLAGFAAGGGGGQLVTDIPCGSLGWHTLRFRPDGSDGAQAVFLGVEPRVSGGGVVVSNLALSGVTTTQEVFDDAAIGNTGLSVSLDMTRPDLTIIQVPTNDWQQHFTVASFKSRLTTIVRRAKTATPVANGGTTANGNCLIVLNQWVDLVNFPADHINNPTFDAYLVGAREVAVAEGAGILDLTELASDFADWNAKGYANDGLHPSPLGHEAIASALFRVLDRF